LTPFARRFVWLKLSGRSKIGGVNLCSESLDFEAVHDLSEWVIAFESMPSEVKKRGCLRCDFEQLRFESDEATLASSR